MNCYFDGSEGLDKDGDSWVTLAGFAAKDETWRGFDRFWQQMLRERYPIAPYIHMWEIISGKDPFERKAGWTREKINILISDAVEMLNSRRDRLRSFSCRVNLSARERIINEGHSVYDPMKLCAEMVTALSLAWKFKSQIELVYFFFDRGEPFMRSLRKQWLANKTPSSQLAINPENRVWDMIGDIQERDMESTPPLQGADMLAWSTTRDLANKLGEFHDVDYYMRQLIPDDHAIIDEALLRKKYLLD
jgi:hypothetical protein